LIRLCCAEIITNRQKALAFFARAQHAEYVQHLAATVRHVKNFHRLMRRLGYNQMSVTDWQSLGRTLSGLVQLAQLAVQAGHLCVHPDPMGSVISLFYFIQHCIICRPSDSNVWEDAGFEL
jgi:DNA mismatch repair ATPase MutS